MLVSWYLGIFGPCRRLALVGILSMIYIYGLAIVGGHRRHWMWPLTTPSAMLVSTTASSQPATLHGFEGWALSQGPKLWWPGWAEQSHGVMASLSIRAFAIHSTWAWCSRSLARCPWLWDSAKIVWVHTDLGCLMLFASIRIINVIFCHNYGNICNLSLSS